MIILTTLYNIDTKGNARHWTIMVDGNKYYSESGLVGSGYKTTQTKPKIAKEKNVGKTNYVSAKDQAYLEAKRKWTEELQKHINAFNYKYFDPPLEDRVIQDKIKYHEKKELGFKCNEEPMCNHCDKKLCLTRPFGIKGQSLFPDLNDLQKINLDEPYYYVNVDGERVRLKDTSYLQEQRLFQRAVMEQVNKVPPTLRKKDFNEMIKLLFAGIEIIEPPKGSSKVEQLLDHLEEYCTDRTASGATKEDMVNGLVWTHEGKHHFIFREFFNKYLLKRRWTEKYDETQLLLRDKCGCTIERVDIGNKKKSVMVIGEFKPMADVYRPKQFKPKDAF